MRPHLEYSNVVLSLRYRKDAQTIENVQRRASRVVVGLENLKYAEHLAELQLPSLVDRRLQGYLIEVYKCIRGCYNTKNSFEAHENNITRGNDFKIKKQACGREVRKRFSVYT